MKTTLFNIIFKTTAFYILTEGFIIFVFQRFITTDNFFVFVLLTINFGITINMISICLHRIRDIMDEIEKIKNDKTNS